MFEQIQMDFEIEETHVVRWFDNSTRGVILVDSSITRCDWNSINWSHESSQASGGKFNFNKNVYIEKNINTK